MQHTDRQGVIFADVFVGFATLTSWFNLRMLHFVSLIPSVFTHVRILLHPNAGCKYVYALFFPRKRKFVQLSRSFYNACVISKPTDAYNCALCTHLLFGQRVFSHPNAWFKYACPSFFFPRCLLVWRIRLFWYACVFGKPTDPIDCTHMGIFSLRISVSFNANACLKCSLTSYFCPFHMFFLQRRVFCDLRHMRYFATHQHIRLPFLHLR